ncbi:LPXTG cell wall anchor domain-containing protein [Rothia sp. P100]|nr:LPXTG cell wall anchor domain-containing protein [Rothia sp. P100]
MKEGEPGFHPGLDSDGNGVGCETDPDYTNDSDDSGYSDSSGLYGSSGYGSNGSSQRLAHTGFTSIMIAAAGALAVFAGGAVLVANRRRKV